MRQPCRCLAVDREHGGERGRVTVLERALHPEPGIADEQTDVGGRLLLEQSVDGGGIREIHFVHSHLDAVPAAEFGRELLEPVESARDEYQVQTGFCQMAGERPADTGRRTGHQSRGAVSEHEVPGDGTVFGHAFSGVRRDNLLYRNPLANIVPEMENSILAKVALVTGASRGVGAATALALADAGYAVACAARSTRTDPRRTPGTLDDVVDAVRARGGTAIAVPVDLSDREQVAAMVEQTVAELGRLDVLVNNAGVTFVGDIDVPLRRHDLVMAIDLDAPLIAIRTAVPHLRAAGGGRILNVSSLAALKPVPGLMSYGIAKVGLERMTIDLARQLAPDHIAVNCFRIDAPVASEGTLANLPGVDHSTFEPSSVAAEGITWMVDQPAEYSGRLESMVHLAHREGIMPTVASRPLTPTEMFTGVHDNQQSVFVDG